MSEPKRYIATPAGFLMVLRQGDDVFGRLEALMREEAISAAVISGFGFVR
jgi:predicted DNA-binding protein with PD1-like motif